MRRLAAALVMALLVLGACSDSGGAEDAASLVETAAMLAGQERSIIRTADLEVAVDHVADAARDAGGIARAAGGLVAGQDADLSGRQDITLELRVPPDRFDEVLDELAGLGDASRRTVTSDDVTEQVVDLDARLATARASAERLRTIIGDATDVNEIVAVEGALAQREAEVESLDAHLRSLRAQVDLSTISLRLVEPSAVEVSDDIPGFIPGLRTGWVALVSTAAVGVTALGFLLPFVVVAALVGLPLLRWRRRRTAAA